MSPSKSSRIGDVLPRVLSDLQLDDALRASEVVARWREVVGERLYGHVQAVSLQQGVLYVEATHPAWIQEIQFQKRRILPRLNQLLQAEAVRDIRCGLRSEEKEA